MADFNTRENTYEATLKLLQRNVPLEKGPNGTYNQEDAAEFFECLVNELKQKHNELTSPGKTGLEELLEDGNNPINGVTTTTGFRAKDFIDKDTKRYNKAIANKDRKDTDPPIPPPVTVPEANEIVDRNNLNVQIILGVKQATKEHIVTEFGSAVTNAHVLKPNSNKARSLDDIKLYDLKKAVMKNAQRATYDSTFKNVSTVLNYAFNWQLTAEQNVEQLSTKAAMLESNGIKVDKSYMVLIILRNMEKAIKSGQWADDLKESFRTIRNKYDADHVHDDTTYKEVLAELFQADKNRTISDAPAPDTEAAEEVNSVYETFINEYLEESETEDEESVAESAYSAASSDSESSADTKSARRALKKKEKEKKARKAAEKKKKKEKKQKRTRLTVAGNKVKGTSHGKGKKVNRDCKHCTTHRRWGSHPDTPEKKCRFNPKAKVWRPKWVADLLGVEYKTRDLFTEENGGYPPIDESDASSGSDSDSE